MQTRRTRKASITDPNGQTTNWSFDNLGRVIQVQTPTNPTLSARPTTNICYNDTAGTCLSDAPLDAILGTESIDSTHSVVTEHRSDALGRDIGSRLLSDPDGVTYTYKTYDPLGRPYQVWNPSRCPLSATTTSCTGETTFGITTSYYDALSRPILTVPPDGNTLTDNIQTSYTGNQTTVVDQAGTSHTTTLDALARLTQVSEDNMGWITDYQYDTLGNLLCAEQHGGVTGTGCSSPPSNDGTSPWRVRRFTYDTLSRLLTATNPETGTISYTYDANSNVTSKTDGRGVTINYNPSASPIDALNRVTEKTYSSGDHAVNYSYDSTSVTNGIGRRTGMTDATGSTAWSYDPEGRTTVEDKTVVTSGSIEKQLVTSYNLLGGPLEVDYPSGQHVVYTTLGAGRVTAATDSVTGEVYANSVHFAPSGALTGAVYGANETPGITIQNAYNKRMQPAVLSAAAGVNTLMSRSYDFGVGVNDNGNVRGVVNNMDSSRNQTFTYDGVNRLVTAQTPSTWGVQFTYDAWGNMTQTSGISGTSLTNPMPEPADRGANYKNQLTSSLVTYGYASAGGNMTSDPTGGAYVYDGENRIDTAGGVTYGYDGEGERVSKSSGTVYWFGGLLETDASGNATNIYVGVNGRKVARIDVGAGKTLYYIDDMLGSSSVVATAAGVVDSESDFYPFGGEKVVTATGSGEHYKFTRKERDTETGNDYFGARFYSSTLGRFLSPDWAAKAEPIPYAKLGNPQSLNLYAYVQGDPESTFDADGHEQIEFHAKSLKEAEDIAAKNGWDVSSVHQVGGDGVSSPSSGAAPQKAGTGPGGAQQKVDASFVPKGGTENLGATAGIIAAETLSVKDGKTDTIADAQSLLAHQRINAERKYGADVDKLAGEMAPITSGKAYDAALASTINAAREDLRGVDSTHGATNYNMRTESQNKAMGDRPPSFLKGMTVHTRSGPFPTWSGPQYILTYGAPQ